MRRLLAIVLFAATTAPLNAQVVIEETFPEGRSYWRIDKSGEAIGMRRIPVAGGPTIPPVDPIDPVDPVDPPSGLSPLAQIAFDEARKVGRPDEAMAVGAVFQGLRDAVDAEEFTVKETLKQTDESLAIIYLALGPGSKTRWNAWRTAIRPELVALSQAGKLRTKADYVKAYDDMRKGLMLSAGTNEARRFNIERILRLVTAILSKDYLAIADIIREILNERRNQGLISEAMLWES